MIFLSLKGTPYEVGFQHGKKLKDLIYYNIRFFCRVWDKNNKEIFEISNVGSLIMGAGISSDKFPEYDNFKTINRDSKF